MTEVHVQPARACLVDLSKGDSSSSADSSVSVFRLDASAKIAGNQSGPDAVVSQSPNTNNGTPPNPKDDLEPRSSSPSTPLYNPFTQHNFSPVRSQRRLSGIGISLSLEDLRNAINQEFPLLMPHEEKKEEMEDTDDGDSDLDPDERLALVAQRIRSEIRQSEMLELAAEAERAAEAGLESFMGRASTFGDDMAVIDSKALKHPAFLKRNSTYSEGFLRQRRLPRLARAKRIKVLALRAVDEVIPPLGEIHSHLRTHLSRTGVDEETLVFQESDYQDVSLRGKSSGFFKNLHNWVSQSSNLGTPTRPTSERDVTWTADFSQNAKKVFPLNLSPNSLLREECEDDNYSSDSSIVGETLAQHIVPSPGSPHHRPMSPVIRIPPGLEWSVVAAAGPKAIPDSISFFDAAPSLPLLTDARPETYRISPSFELDGSGATDKGTVICPSTIPEPITPVALFDAMEESELDAVNYMHRTQGVGPHIPSTEMLTPELQSRKTVDTFLTPARLRDIRDKGGESNGGLAMRTDNLRNVFTSMGPPLLPRKADVPLLPQNLNSAAYLSTTFIPEHPESRLGEELAAYSAPGDHVDFKKLYHPLIEPDISLAADVAMGNRIDDQRSALESGSNGTGEMHSDRDKPTQEDSDLFDSQEQSTELIVKSILPVASGVEQREDNSFQVIHNDPSSEYSLVLTPDDSLIADALESEQRVQPSPTATSTSGNETDEEPVESKIVFKRNSAEPSTPPMRVGCECLVPLSRTDDFDPKPIPAIADDLGAASKSPKLRRVASCPSLVDIIDAEPSSPNSPNSGISRSPSHRREKTVWLSLGREEPISPVSSRRTRRSDSLQAAVDNMFAKLSPTTCGSPKYPFISHADNNDFLNNYLYCSKPAEQWNPLEVTASFDETAQSASVQCVNFFFGSTCEGLSNLVTAFFPNRRSFENREVFTLSKETYTEVDPDSWFNVAAERFDGALERLVGRAREHRNRFQAPSLKKKPPSVRRIVSPSDEFKDDSIILVREKAPAEVFSKERAPEPTLSNQQFRIIYGMSREHFQELNSVARHYNDRYSPDHPEQKLSGGVNRDLVTSLSALAG